MRAKPEREKKSSGDWKHGKKHTVVAALRLIIGDIEIRSRIDVVAGVSNEWRLTPLDASIVEKHVLPLAFVVAAVHCLDVIARCIRIPRAVAVYRIVAVGCDGILCRSGRRVPKLADGAVGVTRHG